VTTPAWGVDSAHYDEAAAAMGVDDRPPPLAAKVPEGSRVLDLGCSVGQLARHLVDRGCTVVGVELDTAAAARAEQWCEAVHPADLDLVELAPLLGDDRFDAIVCADVIEHLRDPARLLREALPLLAPGGVLVATVPNIAHGSVRLALLTGRFEYADLGIMDRTHLRFFTRATLTELLRICGYRVRSIDPLELPVELGVPYDAKALPRGIEKAVKKMPDAEAYSYLVVADPA
jgi:2-polyprenyl-3-methyl-5-hydroxy-6-metoxy-1,4-benzoquinol methylase